MLVLVVVLVTGSGKPDGMFVRIGSMSSWYREKIMALCCLQRVKVTHYCGVLAV